MFLHRFDDERSACVSVEETDLPILAQVKEDDTIVPIAPHQRLPHEAKDILATKEHLCAGDRVTSDIWIGWATQSLAAHRNSIPSGRFSICTLNGRKTARNSSTAGSNPVSPSSMCTGTAI